MYKVSFSGTSPYDELMESYDNIFKKAQTQLAQLTYNWIESVCQGNYQDLPHWNHRRNLLINLMETGLYNYGEQTDAMFSEASSPAIVAQPDSNPEPDASHEPKVSSPEEPNEPLQSESAPQPSSPPPTEPSPNSDGSNFQATADPERNSYYSDQIKMEAAALKLQFEELAKEKEDMDREREKMRLQQKEGELKMKDRYL